MRIATWNVNSIRSRQDQLTAWLARSAPDVICMQETKVEDDSFPHGALAEVGYRAVTFGQKTYNGVAIAAKLGLAIEDVRRNFDGDAPDAQRRASSCDDRGRAHRRRLRAQRAGRRHPGVRLQARRGSTSFAATLAAHGTPQQDILVCGDFNVAPEPLDVYEPAQKWEGSILFTPEEREALKRLLAWGLVDVFRERHQGEPGLYSWWDYRMGAFRKNRGLRIDLALCTRALADRCRSVTIDKRPRELERPSDHAPVVVEID